MSNDIQKADIWKRIAAWIFDAFLVGILAAVCGLFLCYQISQCTALLEYGILYMYLKFFHFHSTFFPDLCPYGKRA